MNKILAIEAIDKCITMWTWLAENPSMQKRDYEPCLKWAGWCALCEYDQQIEGNCSRKGCLVEWPDGCCTHPDSPYRKWEKAWVLTERAAYALEVVALAVAAKARLS